MKGPLCRGMLASATALPALSAVARRKAMTTTGAVGPQPEIRAGF